MHEAQHVEISMPSYHFQRIILASCLTPSCDLTGRPLSYNVALGREADLRDTLIKLGRAGERRESQGGRVLVCLSVCGCVCWGHLWLHTVPVAAWPAETLRVRRRSWWEGWSARRALPLVGHERVFPSWPSTRAGPRSCAHTREVSVEIQAKRNTFYFISWNILKSSSNLIIL